MALLNTKQVSASGVRAIDRIGRQAVRGKFKAIAATTQDGRPSLEQLKMNGMLMNGMLNAD